MLYKRTTFSRKPGSLIREGLDRLRQEDQVKPDFSLIPYFFVSCSVGGAWSPSRVGIPQETRPVPLFEVSTWTELFALRLRSE